MHGHVLQSALNGLQASLTSLVRGGACVSRGSGLLSAGKDGEGNAGRGDSTASHCPGVCDYKLHRKGKACAKALP